MKTTKTIVTAILLCFFAFANAQQKKELTKEETLKYINDLYSQSYSLINRSSVKWTVESVTLEGKILVIKYKGSDGTEDIGRKYLMDYGTLRISEYDFSSAGNISCGIYQITNDNDTERILWCITLESDAKRLKNALEHLIKLLKAEPETDPFAN